MLYLGINSFSFPWYSFRVWCFDIFCNLIDSQCCGLRIKQECNFKLSILNGQVKCLFSLIENQQFSCSGAQYLKNWELSSIPSSPKYKTTFNIQFGPNYKTLIQFISYICPSFSKIQPYCSIIWPPASFKFILRVFWNSKLYWLI